MPPAVVLLSGGNFGFATLSNRRVIRRIFDANHKNYFLTQYESRGTSLHTAKFCSTQPIPCAPLEFVEFYVTNILWQICHNRE